VRRPTEIVHQRVEDLEQPVLQHEAPLCWSEASHHHRRASVETPTRLLHWFPFPPLAGVWHPIHHGDAVAALVAFSRGGRPAFRGGRPPSSCCLQTRPVWRRLTVVCGRWCRCGYSCR
jgi:hypothetical protein